MCSWRLFLLPKWKGKAVLALPRSPFPGKAVAVEWETRPTVLRKNTLGKSSFSHTEEAEAGSQRKVNSKINENREVEEKNQKLPIKPSKM